MLPDNWIAILETLKDEENCLSYARLTEACLYHPTLGYYRQARVRVGKKGDFLTASAHADLLAALLCAAATTLVKAPPARAADPACAVTSADLRAPATVPNSATTAPPADPRATDSPTATTARARTSAPPADPDCAVTSADLRATAPPADLRATATANSPALDFVEVGNEGVGVVQGHSSWLGVFGWGRARTYPLGRPLVFESPCLVFANELLDAQAFHRLRFEGGAWRELGVRLESGCLIPVVLKTLSRPLEALLPDLPDRMPEGYQLDLSLRAEALLGELVSQSATRAVLFLDYGYTWEELLTLRPRGTARAYRVHQVSDRLYEHLGQQDLSCAVCWTRLERVLERAGFKDVETQRQEAFFVERAGHWLEGALEGFSLVEKRRLQSLLHPQHLGGKFQVLSAWR